MVGFEAGTGITAKSIGRHPIPCSAKNSPYATQSSAPKKTRISNDAGFLGPRET